MRVRFRREQSGATAVEYGVLVALIAVAIVGAVRGLSGSLEDSFEVVAQELGADSVAEEGAGGDGGSTDGPGDDDQDPPGGGDTDSEDETNGPDTDTDTDTGNEDPSEDDPNGDSDDETDTGSGDPSEDDPNGDSDDDTDGNTGNGDDASTGDDDSSDQSDPDDTDDETDDSNDADEQDEQPAPAFTAEDVTLEGAAIPGNGANWDANVTIQIDNAPDGAVLRFTWTYANGGLVEDTCTIEDGQCEINEGLQAPSGQATRTFVLQLIGIDDVDFADLDFEDEDLEVKITSP